MNADIFVRLGDRLADFGCDERSRAVIARAVVRNPWFSEDSIVLAVNAIRAKMLDRDALTGWLANYRYDFSAQRGKLGIVMAGNIPAVGFFDLMCGLICGYECHVHTSSKDLDTIGYLIELLGVKVFDNLPSEGLDALIASGSDATIAQLRAQYVGISMLLRDSRSSIAVLTGAEDSSQLTGLQQDIFLYNGLGCRNVSHLFLPTGYPVERLVGAFAGAKAMVEMWSHNYLQNRALKTMNGEPFVDGGFFILRPSDEFPATLGEITYQFYDDLDEVRRWISGHDSQLQCVVSEVLADSVPFGQAQFPTLTDYPDRVDVIDFLCHA